MKKTLYILLAGILAACLFSCMKQDDIYKEFVVPGGLKYPQKVDTLIVRSGLNKLEICWPKAIDPSVVKARLFWNSGLDSLEVDMTSVEDTARVILDNLEEISYSFQVYTYDAQGNRSVVTEQSGIPYGDKYLTSKSLKEVLSGNMVASSFAEFKLSGPVADLQYCEFTYTSTSGEEKTVIVDPESRTLQIEDFNNEYPYKMRCVYKPDKGVDEVPGEWIEYNGPLPVEVVELPKGPWKNLALPTDSWRSYAGLWFYAFENLWNGACFGDAGECWASEVGPKTIWFSIDLGYTVSLVSVQLYHRLPYEQYAGSGVRRFQLWGSNDPAADGSWDSWTFLGEFETQKPSGYAPDGSVGTITNEDQDYFNWRNIFTLEKTDLTPDAFVPVRYVRFKMLDTFESYGNPNWSGLYVIGEISLKGTFASLEERNQYLN